MSVANTLAYYILVQASMVKSITESYCSAFISICCYAAQEARSSTDFITGTGVIANDNSAISAKCQIWSLSNKTQLFSSLTLRLNKLECLSLSSFHASLTSDGKFRSLPEWSTEWLRSDTQILDWSEKNCQGQTV